MTNATASFEIAYKYANLKPGDEVIVPAITFVATMAYPLAEGAKLVLVYGIGRACHIAFWEPAFAEDYKTLVPCHAYIIGLDLFLQADYAIGACDGALGRGMGWQGMSFFTTLHYGPGTHITSTYIPTLPGKLFYLSELAGPLVAECN